MNPHAAMLRAFRLSQSAALAGNAALARVFWRSAKSWRRRATFHVIHV